MDDDPDTLRGSDLAVDVIEEDPVGRDRKHLDREYVTFRNEGTTPLSISGWTVEDEAGNVYRFPERTVLDPDGHVTLHSGDGDDTETDFYWGSDRPLWRNDGDTIRVRDDGGVLRLRESYNE